MNEAAALLGTLFVLGMMGLGLALLLKGAREEDDEPSRHRELWPRQTG